MVTGTHVCSLHTLPIRERVSEIGPGTQSAPWPEQHQRHDQTPDSTAPGAQAGTSCARALTPGPARDPRLPQLPWPGRERSEDLQVSSGSALPGAAARPGTHLGAGPPSAPAAPAAGRRPPTPGWGPAPRALPWVPPPGAAALGPWTCRGPGATTASMAPGRRANVSRRCWALRPPAAQGPGATGRAEAERPGGGAEARGGAGVAGTRRGRPLALRASARRTAGLWRGPEGPEPQGRSRAGAARGRFPGPCKFQPRRRRWAAAWARARPGRLGAQAGRGRRGGSRVLPPLRLGLESEPELGGLVTMSSRPSAPRPKEGECAALGLSEATRSQTRAGTCQL